MRDVVGFEGRYAVTSCGRVWSYRSNRFLKQNKLKNGYLQVYLCNGKGKVLAKLVHRLVAEAYIPNPENLETIDHIDNDKTHNYVNNLQWMSRGENTSKGQRDNDRLVKIRCVENGEVYESLMDCEKKTGCFKGNLSMHLKGHREHVNGLHFVIVDDLERNG